MIIPKFISSNSKIGVTALSDGNRKEVDFIRLQSAKDTLERKGYSVIETSNVRNSIKGRSSDAVTRVKEFMDLVDNPYVSAIIAAKGGDFLFEILPLIDFRRIKEKPTWIQGYSDVTGILFTVTTICGIATIYSNNFNDFGMRDWHESISNNLSILQGVQITQKSFERYEDGFYDKITGLEGYTLEKPVCWLNARGEEFVHMEGLLLGGCLDVLLNLTGTRFDRVAEFNQNQGKDGVLWYLESFDLGSEALARGLWQLKEAGWFQKATGFVFGRPAMYRTFTDTSYQEAVLSVLDPLRVPIVLDADIGHKSPQFTVVNGAFGIIESTGGKGSLTMKGI